MMTPLGERVLVEMAKPRERTTAAGIVIAGTEPYGAREGIIRAGGKEGDIGKRVVFSAGAGVSVNDLGWRIIDVKDLLGVYDE